MKKDNSSVKGNKKGRDVHGWPLTFKLNSGTSIRNFMNVIFLHPFCLFIIVKQTTIIELDPNWRRVKKLMRFYSYLKNKSCAIVVLSKMGERFLADFFENALFVAHRPYDIGAFSFKHTFSQKKYHISNDFFKIFSKKLTYRGSWVFF